MTDDIAHIALHDDRETIVTDAVRTLRQNLGYESAFAALLAEQRDGYHMDVVDGITDPRFRELLIRPGRGLGGQVLAEHRGRAVDDYLSESTITADYVPVVAREGLRGMGSRPRPRPRAPSCARPSPA